MLRAQRRLVHYRPESDLAFQMRQEHGPGEVPRPDDIQPIDRRKELTALRFKFRFTRFSGSSQGQALWQGGKELLLSVLMIRVNPRVRRE